MVQLGLVDDDEYDDYDVYDEAHPVGAVTEAAVACSGRADIARAGVEYARAFRSLIEALRLKQ